jgi:hypothetical protein
MYTGEVLKLIDGLTKDGLSYFVRAGFVKPKKIEVDNFYFNDFSEEDVELIKRARKLDFRPEVRRRKALERANKSKVSDH